MWVVALLTAHTSTLRIGERWGNERRERERRVRNKRREREGGREHEDCDITVCISQNIVF